MMSGGQTFNDRLTAARHSIAGQGLAKSVCKSTTEEVIGPKKKHLDYLLHCTNEPNVSIPQLANLLIERTQNSSWVVVFKALITVHHLMCYGNERFTQYLASSNCSFQLGNFLDKSGVQGYDMSTFIRRYAKYLNEKALSYRTVAFDFCKGKRGKEDGVLRTMNADKLLKTLPVLQNQIDALLEFDCTANELGNGVINSAFMLLFRDLIRLFACYNDGIINLLEKYFDMNKKMCREALDIYKKFLIRMDRVAEFLKVAESMGIEKHEIPDISEAPSSLLDALEQHLASLEGRKGSGAGTPTQPSGQPAYFKSAVTALSSTSNSFGSAAAATTGREVNGTPMDESLKKQVLEEEQAVLNQHKVMKENERRLKELAAQSPTGPSTGSTSTNPFLTSPTAQPNQQPVIDLFGSPPASTTTPTTATGKSSDDLLCLTSNPFAESIINNSQPATGSNAFQNNFWGSQNGFATSNAAAFSNTASMYTSENAFATLFDNSNNASIGASHTSAPAPGFDAFGDILQPVSQSANPPTSQAGLGKTTASGKVITGDLDSSLASLAQNLDINRGAVSMQNFSCRGGHVWNSPKNTTKTGGANWTPQIASTTASWNSPQHAFKPMGGMQGSTANDGISADWAGGGAGSGIGGAFPKTGPAPKIDQQPLMAGPRPGMPPAGMMGMNVGIGMGTMGMPPAMSQQPLFNAMPARPAQPPAFNTPMPVGQPQQQSTTLDPFGAL